MPDSTRPTRSTFFKLVRSLISSDPSLSRIASHPGGKNFNIIFAYITSLAYDRVFHSESDNKKMGIEFINAHKDEWFTIDQFLSELEWGGINPDYATHALQILFNSFHQDGVFDIQGDFPSTEYKFIQELDYPSDEQIESARLSNKYFMLAIDDLIDELPHTLFFGTQTSSRTRAAQLPMWEAILNDPLSEVYRNEMLFLVEENLDTLKVYDKLVVLDIAAGTGSATINLLPKLVEKYESMNIDIFLVEEIGNQLKRAQESIQAFDTTIKKKCNAKGITIKYHYITQSYSKPIDLPKDSVHIVLSYQNLHYLSDEERKNYFRNTSKLLHPKGLAVITQLTSHSELFPHPLSLAFLVVEGFKGFPTVDQMDNIVQEFYKSHKSSGIDSLWVLKDPKL